jgi:hypothetical protein
VRIRRRLLDARRQQNGSASEQGGVMREKKSRLASCVQQINTFGTRAARTLGCIMSRSRVVSWFPFCGDQISQSKATWRCVAAKVAVAVS